MYSQEAAVPVKKSRLPEEEEEREGGKQQEREEDEGDDEEALKKARDFDDFKDGMWPATSSAAKIMIPFF